MAKREGTTSRTNNTNVTNTAPAATTASAIEERVVAFAEQLGRIVGTVQAKADGWMDRDALSQQIASVRDSAAGLLEQLAGGAAPGANEQPAAAAPRAEKKNRSGGVVDAPGKKHRKPAPADPRAAKAGSQAAKMRTARTMVKTNRRRGRG